MSRRVVPLGIVMTAACLSVAWCTPIDKAAEDKAKEAEGFTPRKLIAGLDKRVTTDKLVEVPLAAVLEFLQEKTGLPIVVDEKAFEAAGLPKVNEQAVTLPAFKGVRAATVLRLLTKQLRTDTAYAGAYLVRGDHIELTTAYDALVELTGTEVPHEKAKAGPDGPGPEPEASLKPELAPVGNTKRLMLPIVHVDFTDKPLRDAVADLADASGATIVVDGRLGEKAKEAVTIRLTNAFLDTALDLIAESADLEVVRVDNTFYVTTPDRAEKLRKQRPRRYDGGSPLGPNFRPGGGA